MPCFTASVKQCQILMQVFITAPALAGEGNSVVLGEDNSFNAVVDTGATISCISLRVAEKIGVNPMEKGELQTASGVLRANVYYVNLHIPIAVGVTKENKSAAIDVKNFSQMRVSEASLPGHFDVLLGMDVIMSGGSLHFSGGSYTFCT